MRKSDILVIGIIGAIVFLVGEVDSEVLSLLLLVVEIVLERLGFVLTE